MGDGARTIGGRDAVRRTPQRARAAVRLDSQAHDGFETGSSAQAYVMANRPPRGKDDDASLMEALIAGSEAALASLYDRYASAVYGVAYRLTRDRQATEEVVQVTFLALWDRAETYDPTAAPLISWLLAIARNRCIDRLRAAGRRPKVLPFSSLVRDPEAEASALDSLAAAGGTIGGAADLPGPEGALLTEERRESIARAVASLPEAERTVIGLAYRGELSQSEIAEHLGWPLGTVKTRTRRALRRLRGALDETADETSPRTAGRPSVARSAGDETR